LTTTTQITKKTATIPKLKSLILLLFAILICFDENNFVLSCELLNMRRKLKKAMNPKIHTRFMTA
jgi:hypothetical protein